MGFLLLLGIAPACTDCPRPSSSQVSRRRSAPEGTDNIRVESTTGAVAVGGGGSRYRRLSPLPVPHSSP